MLRIRLFKDNNFIITKCVVDDYYNLSFYISIKWRKAYLKRKKAVKTIEKYIT